MLPTFDMYEVAVTALGGTMTSVPLGDEFMFSADAVAAAVNDATRIVFVTSPHNPTGRAVPLDVLRRLAERVAPAMFFLDEAYAGFTGETLIDADVFAALPNLVVGRTFAKAHGLAGLRAGAVFAAPALMESIRKVVPPYSLNAVAAAALPAALDDREYTAWYYDQCRASRALLAAACSRLGLRSFPSVTNFMLVEIGPRAAALAAALAARGVAVRDRSASPGSPGCLRMTTGRVDDTERLVAALEDAWRAGA